MASYKDAIIEPGLPNKNNKNKENKVEKKGTQKSEVEIVIDSYLDMLREDESFKRNEETLNHANMLIGNYKNDCYKKMYEIYLKYINFEDKKDLMQIQILKTIENNYKKQIRELAQKENEKICQINGHDWDKKWVKTANGWARKCLVCNKKQTSSIDPNKIIKKEEEENKGSQRKRRK